MFRFGEPQLLYLLVLLPLLAAFLFWVIRRKRQGIRVLVGPHMAPRLTGNSSSRRQWAKGFPGGGGRRPAVGRPGAAPSSGPALETVGKERDRTWW